MAGNVLKSSKVGTASCKSHHHFDEGVHANSFFHTRTVPPVKGNPTLRILCPLKQAHRDCLPRLQKSFTRKVFAGSPFSSSPHWDSTRTFRYIASNLSNPPGHPEESEEHTYRILKLKETAEREADQTKVDTADDATFYERPRFVYHTDQSYIDRLTALYRRRLKEGSRILDLMSSWVSHLPADMSFDWVEGHGMNEAELLANKRLDHFWIQVSACSLPTANHANWSERPFFRESWISDEPPQAFLSDKDKVVATYYFSVCNAIARLYLDEIASISILFPDACCSLTSWVLQDLNKSQALPHEDEAFDAVLISLGIQYLENLQKVS
jgi:hypothetical protein